MKNIRPWIFNRIQEQCLRRRLLVVNDISIQNVFIVAVAATVVDDPAMQSTLLMVIVVVRKLLCRRHRRATAALKQETCFWRRRGHGPFNEIITVDAAIAIVSYHHRIDLPRTAASATTTTAALDMLLLLHCELT